jgi:hypothetical protein
MTPTRPISHRPYGIVVNTLTSRGDGARQESRRKRQNGTGALRTLIAPPRPL